MFERFRNSIAREFKSSLLPFIAFSIALNLTMGQVTAALKIPLYLDSIGTILTAVLIGPWAAMVTGAAANILSSALGMPAMMFFIPVVVSIGFFTALLAKFGWFKRWYLLIPGGLLQGGIAALISAPIAARLFGGTMGAGTDLLVLFFRWLGFSLETSVLFQGLVSDPLDKMISYLLIFLIVRSMPQRMLRRFPGAANVLSSQPAAETAAQPQ